METTKKRLPVYIVAALILIVLIGSVVAMSVNREESLSVDELLSLGEKYLLDLDYEQALAQFLKVIGMEPMNERGYTGAAEAYVGLDDMDRAITIMEQGLEAIDNKDIAAILNALTQPEDETEPILEKIEITSLPKVDYTVGQHLDLTGLVVKSIYDDGTEREIVDYTTDPADGEILTVNNANVMISYDGKTIELALTIMEPEPFSLQDLKSWGYHSEISVWDLQASLGFDSDELSEAINKTIEIRKDEFTRNSSWYAVSQIDQNIRMACGPNGEFTGLRVEAYSELIPTGPRNIEIGMGMEEVIGRFACENSNVTDFAQHPSLELFYEYVSHIYADYYDIDVFQIYDYTIDGQRYHAEIGRWIEDEFKGFYVRYYSADDKHYLLMGFKDGVLKEYQVSIY